MSIAMDTRDHIQGNRAIWSWFRGASRSFDRAVDERLWRSTAALARWLSFPVRGDARRERHPVHEPVASEPRAAAQIAPRQHARDGVHNGRVDSGAVLQFPIRGEALLVKLAELLRNRIPERGPQRDPLLLTMSRCPDSRLAIDRSTYIEFQAGRSAFYVAIEADSDTTVTLDTTDFDTAVQFVVQYVNGKLSQPVALEAAS